MARQLARLNVDVIEAGFPISSDEDFEATREVARQVGIHLKYKLRTSRAEGLKAAVEAVRHARAYCEDVETSRLLSHITGVHVQPNKAIVGENAFAHEEYLHVLSGTGVIPSATVKLRKDSQDSWIGDGPVDAVLVAIDAITGVKGRLQDYAIRAATSGQDAVGEVSVKVDFDTTVVSGRGASTDVIEASARAYLSALNRMARSSGQRTKDVGP